MRKANGETGRGLAQHDKVAKEALEGEAATGTFNTIF